MNPTVRAEFFGILTSLTTCHACGQSMPVSALVVPAHDELGGEEWFLEPDNALLTYVEDIDPISLQEWRSRASWIRPMDSKTAGIRYFGNACFCGALQGDWFLTEPDGPFFPQDEVGLASITVKWVMAPIQARASTSRSTWIDNLVAITPYEGWIEPPRPNRRRKKEPPRA